MTSARRLGGIFDPANATEFVVEIRFGEGGEDSKLFVDDLAQAYLRYAEAKQLNPEVLAIEDGYFSFRISGPSAWPAFRNEPGKHVVQRVPPTETRGRRQTSVVSVAVTPLFEITKETIPESEIMVKTQGGSGPGGQHQNKTASAVRMRHIPTGIEVFINGRKQNQNYREALRILTARVNAAKYEAQNQELQALRSQQHGGGGRTGKRRTYNFIQSRVVDHVLNTKTRQIERVMKGQFELILE